MPTYEYECLETGRRFEARQRMSDEPLEQCPECNGPVRRLISGGGGVLFKGKGFYATDYGGSTHGCGRNTRCCGRDEPCGSPPCES
jgi:putative FmdB family regulatory protein